MLGPERHFVREQSIRNITTSASEGGGREIGELTPIRPLVPEGRHVGRPSSAGRRAHLYLENAGSDRLGKIYARVVFYEQSPGQQGLAAALALLQAIVTVTVMWVLGDLIKRNVAFDLPALFLAIPGVLSAIAYPRSSSHGVHQTPIRARLVLIGTTAVAMFTTLSYVCLSAWGVSQPSGWVYGAWLVCVLGDVVSAIWCYIGARWNRDAYNKAVDYRNDQSDFFTESDYDTLMRWDAERKGG